MRNLALAIAVAAGYALAGAGTAHANAVNGELWVNQSGVAGDALLSSVPGLGTPDATFTPGAINYQSQLTAYTIGAYLNNPVFSNESANFITNGGAGADLDNTVIYLTGTVGLLAGNNSFVLAHDDGLQLNIDGIGLALNQPGPTAETFTPFNVDAPTMGNYNFELVYGECCGPPADLVWSINNVQIGGSVPEPASLALFGSALLGLGAAKRRKRKTS